VSVIEKKKGTRKKKLKDFLSSLREKTLILRPMKKRDKRNNASEGRSLKKALGTGLSGNPPEESPQKKGQNAPDPKTKNREKKRRATTNATPNDAPSKEKRGVGVKKTRKEPEENGGRRANADRPREEKR